MFVIKDYLCIITPYYIKNGYTLNMNVVKDGCQCNLVQDIDLSSADSKTNKASSRWWYRNYYSWIISKKITKILMLEWKSIRTVSMMNVENLESITSYLQPFTGNTNIAATYWNFTQDEQLLPNGIKSRLKPRD